MSILAVLAVLSVPVVGFGIILSFICLTLIYEYITEGRYKHNKFYASFHRPPTALEAGKTAYRKQLNDLSNGLKKAIEAGQSTGNFYYNCPYTRDFILKYCRDLGYTCTMYENTVPGWSWNLNYSLVPDNSKARDFIKICW